MMKEQARFVPHLLETDKKEPESPEPKQDSPKRSPVRQASFTKMEKKIFMADKELPKLHK